MRLLDQHEIIRVELGLEHALKGNAVVDVELEDHRAADVGRGREDGVEIGKAEGGDVEDIAEAFVLAVLTGLAWLDIQRHHL